MKTVNYCHTKACHDRESCELANDGNGKQLMFGDGDDQFTCRQFILIDNALYSQPCDQTPKVMYGR